MKAEFAQKSLGGSAVEGVSKDTPIGVLPKLQQQAAAPVVDIASILKNSANAVKVGNNMPSKPVMSEAKASLGTGSRKESTSSVGTGGSIRMKPGDDLIMSSRVRTADEWVMNTGRPGYSRVVEARNPMASFQHSPGYFSSLFGPKTGREVRVNTEGLMERASLTGDSLKSGIKGLNVQQRQMQQQAEIMQMLRSRRENDARTLGNIRFNMEKGFNPNAANMAFVMNRQAPVFGMRMGM